MSSQFQIRVYTIIMFVLIKCRMNNKSSDSFLGTISNNNAFFFKSTQISFKMEFSIIHRIKPKNRQSIKVIDESYDQLSHETFFSFII